MQTLRNLKMGILAGLLLLTSCGDLPGVGCTDLYAYGLNVTVKDDTTNQPICDAVVKAIDGSHTEQLQNQSLGSDCTYVGAGERAGNYTITAMKSGYQDLSQSGNVVTKDICHVKGITVALRLKR